MEESMLSQPPVKQVIVVRKDLKMRQGKTAAQVAHASMGVITDELLPDLNSDRVLKLWLDEELDAWLNGAFTKVVVYVESEEELLAIHRAAKLYGCRTKLIQDSGKTEFHGIPTYTTVAVGPNFCYKVDQVTKSLPLL